MFSYIRPQDIADIIIMTSLVYLLYSWFKNTRALQVVFGLGFLVVLYVVTKNLGLFMTSWILQELGTVLFVLIVVIFQTEIRQALYRFSLLRNLFERRESELSIDPNDLAKTMFSLAASRTGAIVVFQRNEMLDEYLLHGIPLDSLFSAQLIGTIFRDGTPLHDGAVVIRDGRITQASCHLPLSSHVELPQHFGTRHRAGLGLSERSDAVVVIVSEERGEVTLALGGELLPMPTPEQLRASLTTLLAPPSPEVVKVPLKERLFSNIGPKLTILFLVIASWMIIAVRQGGIVTVAAQVKYRNLPENLVLVKSVPEEIEVQLKTFSSLSTTPKQLELVADIDLSKVKEGGSSVAITSSDFRLPLGVSVTGITPSVVKVTTEKKVHKSVSVRVKTVGRLSGNLKLRSVRVEPATVSAEGPERIMAHLDVIETEAVDLADIHQSTELTKRLLQPFPQVRVLAEEGVRVRLQTLER